MTKKIVPNKGMIDIEVLSNPSAFKSKVNLDAVTINCCKLCITSFSV
jgi:hypothetical protein